MRLAEWNCGYLTTSCGSLLAFWMAKNKKTRNNLVKSVATSGSLFPQQAEKEELAHSRYGDEDHRTFSLFRTLMWVRQGSYLNITVNTSFHDHLHNGIISMTSFYPTVNKHLKLHVTVLLVSKWGKNIMSTAAKHTCRPNSSDPPRCGLYRPLGILWRLTPTLPANPLSPVSCKLELLLIRFVPTKAW